METCNTCGEDRAVFIEGHCEYCYQTRQDEIYLHNAEYNRWQSLTPAQRDDEIKRAYG